MPEAIDPKWLIDQLDKWVNALAAPLVPPKVITEGGRTRFEFQKHSPEAVLVGKLVRAVSGLRAALLLAERGYVAESAALLRMVSDFCTEMFAISEGVLSGKMTSAVQEFIDQFFRPRARSAAELEAAGKTKWVSREELMKAEARASSTLKVDGKPMLQAHRFLNFGLDGYVHGAYESVMELCEGSSGQFAMRGHPSADVRSNFTTFALLKAHEVVVAIEFTASVMENADIHATALAVRRTMDASPPWTSPDEPF